MDKIRIIGGRPLEGRITISGAKNAALPLLAAALLTEGELVLSNVPKLADVTTMATLLAQHGVTVRPAEEAHTLRLCGRGVDRFTAPYELVRTMRASVLVLGPLLARFGEAHVSLPGGCAIGTRPIDLHLKAMEDLGATITVEAGYVHAKAPAGGLRGGAVHFEKISVGATENILMAAALANGVTEITNAACEPEITDLAQCLIAMGAAIEGVGTPNLRVTGQKALHGAAHCVIADRIEAGTYAACAAITGGEVELLGIDPAILASTLDKYEEAGLTWRKTAGGLTIRRVGTLHGTDVLTQAYPGFATDMQAQFMALMTMAEGASMITETIFENRFMHAPELIRMGANITVHQHSALVRGVKKLKGAEVMATDLRASVAMVIAALAAEGETMIHRVYHLDRGYEALEEKLRACGADVERVV